jgi:hypothetical protein
MLLTDPYLGKEKSLENLVKKQNAMRPNALYDRAKPTAITDL